MLCVCFCQMKKLARRQTDECQQMNGSNKDKKNSVDFKLVKKLREDELLRMYFSRLSYKYGHQLYAVSLKVKQVAAIIEMLQSRACILVWVG